ncbi:MAG: bifunctional demethylmenaquinone methyltransferase/2-methoxy-6-polyprenyl-1,4-benzoquinol methylase UbiE [Bacteroidia bacterium]|nr:bifunctional demethylmenaquinone methyltransferase/2-methoxy-6-polyprenyl-1,4-benzoquinol methylase UbiE [Bacteroidia bacterium]
MKVVLPYGTGNSKKDEVERMFDSIAPRYDFLNRLLSLGIDIRWRKKAVRQLKKLVKPGSRILDVATGTADLALECLKLHPYEIIGIDISQKMLSLGYRKIQQKKISNIRLLHTDIMQYQDHEGFDVVVVAFGIRNFENPKEGLKKMHALLKPGGILLVLEFSKPGNRLFGMMFQCYFKFFLPFIGKMVSGDRRAYAYLPESVETFPSGSGFGSWMSEAGFSNVEFHTMTGGVVTMYLGMKKTLKNY